MYTFCIENPDKAIAFSRLFSLAIAEFEEANEIKSEISNQLLLIKKELGEELCTWYAKNHKGLADLQIILDSYVKSYKDAQKYKEQFKQLIKSIEYNNYDAKVVPLLYASGAKYQAGSLLELFKKAKIYCVRDLLRLAAWKINEEENLQLVTFIKWLREDKKAELKNELLNLFRKDRDEAILKKRAGGATLEETSKDYALTHEGVRQIEKKYQSRFERYVINMRPHYILYSFSKNISYITINDISEVLGADSTDIFTYCLKKCNCSTANWSAELNGFIIGDGKWYEQLKAYKEGLPDMIDGDTLDKLIGSIVDNLGLPIAFEETKRFVLGDYTLSGKVYLKKKMSLSQMYKAVLKKYYPDGIKLYEDSEAARFRSYVRELFGDIYLPENNRAIEVRLTEITILCDRGKRILPSGVKIPTELLRKIHDTIIESNRNVIMYSALFERFKDELLKHSNITNKYFLQGVLKLNYSNEFIFTRYTVRKELQRQISSAV